MQLNTNKYKPFGMLMPDRQFSADDYPFGFNRQERDDEIKGKGNSLEFKFRIYDSRLGRFFSIDPISSCYPMYSPYHFAQNNPIYYVELEGKEGLYYLMALYYKWSEKLGKATSDLIQAQSNTASYNNNAIPKEVQENIKRIKVGEAAKTYHEAMTASADLAVDAVTSIPGVDAVGDLSGAAYYGAKGDYYSAALYAAAVFIPSVSGSEILKISKPLIEGSIKVFENGKSILKEAFKIGNYGHSGTKEYNTIVNAIGNGGNFVVKSEEEALKFLNEAFDKLPNETGLTNQSKYGYRIDVDKEGADGVLQQGHTGTHINYYDKANDIKGSITIIPE